MQAKTELLGSIRFNAEFDSELLPKLEDWILNRGGILAWENQEIGSCHAREIFTPVNTESGESIGIPGWRYQGKPLVVDLSSAMVVHAEIVEQYAGRIKRNYWGIDLFGEKHNRIMDRHKQANPKCEYSYRFDYLGYGLATVYIERLVKNKLFNSLCLDAQKLVEQQRDLIWTDSDDIVLPSDPTSVSLETPKQV